MMEVRDAWGEVLRNHLTDYRLEVDREVQSKKMAVENVLDLGSKFNDPRLNQKWVDENGEEKPVFEYSEENGIISLKCTVCGITTTCHAALSHLS